eukprot:scaffold121752_cov29-Tisochrysis_lutea.AAC.8
MNPTRLLVGMTVPLESDGKPTTWCYQGGSTRGRRDVGRARQSPARPPAHRASNNCLAPASPNLFRRRERWRSAHPGGAPPPCGTKRVHKGAISEGRRFDRERERVRRDVAECKAAVIKRIAFGAKAPASTCRARTLGGKLTGRNARASSDVSFGVADTLSGVRGGRRSCALSAAEVLPPPVAWHKPPEAIADASDAGDACPPPHSTPEGEYASAHLEAAEATDEETEAPTDDALVEATDAGAASIRGVGVQRREDGHVERWPDEPPLIPEVTVAKVFSAGGLAKMRVVIDV